MSPYLVNKPNFSLYCLSPWPTGKMGYKFTTAVVAPAAALVVVTFAMPLPLPAAVAVLP
jgi:hypothetical protein